MAQLAASFIVQRVVGELSNALLKESLRLVKVRSEIEWIGEELRYMVAFLQGLEPSNSIQLELELEIRSIALQAEDVIETFLDKATKRRETGVQYLLEQYDIAKELKPICDKVREISEKIKNYEYEKTNIAVTVETPPAVRDSSIVSTALEKLDHILSKNIIILDEELIEIAEGLRDKDLADTQNIVSSLNSTSKSQRAKVWLEDIEDICAYTVDVAQKFISSRTEMGCLSRVFYFSEQRVSERQFKQQLKYISTRLEDALYRRWTFGDGGKDMGDQKGSRSRPDPTLSLVRLTLAKVPLFLFNSSFVLLLFALVITVFVDHSMFGRKRRAREHKGKEKKRSTILLWSDLVDFVFFVFFYAFPVQLLVLFQFAWILCTLIAWTMSLESSLIENLKTTERYLALMNALFSDIQSSEGLNRRQQVWVEQLKRVAQKGHFLNACPEPRVWLIFKRIRFGEDVKEFLNEILDTSDKKNIYGFANIQGTTVPGSASENIAQHSGASSFQGVTGIRWKYQLITDEMQLMNALSDDVQEPGELEGRSKIWVEQMGQIASKAEDVIRECASELEHKPMLIYIFRFPARYAIMGDIDGIIEKIEDASRRRNTYGLVQLQSRDESLSMVQILRRIPQPSLIGKQSKIVGFEEDVMFLTDHLRFKQEHRRCITSIVGIRGTGKKTLATLILENEDVKVHFPYTVRVSVSPSWTPEQLLEETRKVAAKLTGEGKQDALRTLADKRYLIILDDIQTSHLLDTLTKALPDNSKGSRILLTTCDANIVAPQESERCFVYHLQLLDDEKSWILFKNNLKVPIPSEQKLIEIGKKIVARCGGLPFEILRMSDLLSERVVTEEEWSSVQEQPYPSPKPWSETNPWSETFDTGNFKLPWYLQRCLFYLRLFPVNFGIPARRLIILWVTEGLVQPGENQEPPEQVAERYLIELIDLNLVQIVKRSSNGTVKTCRLPNIVRDILIEKAKEYISQAHTSTGSNAVQRNSRIRQVADRLSKEEDAWYDDIHGKTTSDSASRYKDVFSFLSFDNREGSKPGQDIGNFLNLCISSKSLLLLRVLDLEGVYKPELPRNIDKLARLRYLGLRWTYLESLPSSISKMLKLQTLDLKHTYIHTLTSSIWKMQLRHLFLSETYRTRFPPKPRDAADFLSILSETCRTRFPPILGCAAAFFLSILSKTYRTMFGPGASDSLSNLQTLWGLFVDEETPVKGDLDKLVNITKLGIACQSMSVDQKAMESKLDEVADWIVKLEYLQSLRLKSRNEEGKPCNLRLKSLEHCITLRDMYLLGSLSGCDSSILFPPSLVELTLSHSRLVDDPMVILKDLPNLRSLSLLAESCDRMKMTCESKSFPQLRVLKIWKLEQLKELIIEEEALPSLRQLEIRSCPGIKKIPDGLKHVENLLELKLTNMSKEINTDDKHDIPLNCHVQIDDSP